jgi:hypothetical protein
LRIDCQLRRAERTAIIRFDVVGRQQQIAMAEVYQRRQRSVRVQEEIAVL